MIIEYAEWRIQGRVPGARAPLILDQNEAQRLEIIFLAPPPPYLRVWMTDPPPYLKVWIRHRCGTLISTKLSL